MLSNWNEFILFIIQLTLGKNGILYFEMYPVGVGGGYLTDIGLEEDLVP